MSTAFYADLRRTMREQNMLSKAASVMRRDMVALKPLVCDLCGCHGHTRGVCPMIDIAKK